MLSETTRHKVPEKPLIAIIGATGTGKSQLAVELAKRYNGEVINGDAMQLYAGLPVITNKITKAEQQGIPHHLLGCIGLHEPTWVVSTFVARALQAIADIRGRGKLPILVGGTHYYTQSLIFNDALAEREDHQACTAPVELAEVQWPVLAQPTDVLLDELRKVDPTMASRWHPKDRRKIQRSLMIYLQNGVPASEIYVRQQTAKAVEDAQNGDVSDEQSSTSTHLRFPTLLFWVHANQDALHQRLYKRVDSMLDNGLLQEVDQLEQHAALEACHGKHVDTTRGIWVSIGFKEFQPYYKALQSQSNEPELSKAKVEAIEKTKIANRQYAKRQLRWIRAKLMHSLARAGATDELYLLDSSDAAKYEDNVVHPAANLTRQFLEADSRQPPIELSPLAAEMLVFDKVPAVRTVEHCQACDITCATTAQWQAHIKSKAHRKRVTKVKNNDSPACDGN